MNPEFGELYDCRKAPAIGHFVVSLGLKRSDEVMYFLITSRVYAVFSGIINFFTDCLVRGYTRFGYYYPKEASKTTITPHGRLSDALFLDKDTDYNLALKEDSMVVLNREPEIIERPTFDALRSAGKASQVSRLTELDACRLMEMIRHSVHIPPQFKHTLARNYNADKRSRAQPVH